MNGLLCVLEGGLALGNVLHMDHLAAVTSAVLDLPKEGHRRPLGVPDTGVIANNCSTVIIPRPGALSRTGLRRMPRFIRGVGRGGSPRGPGLAEDECHEAGEGTQGRVAPGEEPIAPDTGPVLIDEGEGDVSVLGGGSRRAGPGRAGLGAGGGDGVVADAEQAVEREAAQEPQGRAVRAVRPLDEAHTASSAGGPREQGQHIELRREQRDKHHCGPRQDGKRGEGYLNGTR